MSRVTCHVDSLNVLRSWDCVSVCVLDIPQSSHIIRLNRKSVLPLWIIICTVFLAVFVAKICVSFTSKLGLASHFPPNSLPCPGSWLLADGWMIKIWLKVLEEFILAAMIFSLNIHKDKLIILPTNLSSASCAVRESTQTIYLLSSQDWDLTR